MAFKQSTEAQEIIYSMSVFGLASTQTHLPASSHTLRHRSAINTFVLDIPYIHSYCLQGQVVFNKRQPVLEGTPCLFMASCQKKKVVRQLLLLFTYCL